MKRIAILLAVFVIVETALLVNNAALDTLAWRTTRWISGDQDAYKWAEYKKKHADNPDAPFYQRVDPPMSRYNKDKGAVEARLYGRTQNFWRLFRDLGEPQLAVILVCAAAIYDRRRWKAGVMLASGAIAAGAVGMLIRMTTGRLRPDGVLLDDAMKPLREAGKLVRNDGGNHWYWFRGFSFDASDLAFPSGHATLAFALAAVLSYLSPKGRVLFFVLAALCAHTRVVMQAHFFADVLMGAVVGTSIGWFVAKWMDRWASKGEMKAIPA